MGCGCSSQLGLCCIHFPVLTAPCLLFAGSALPREGREGMGETGVL